MRISTKPRVLFIGTHTTFHRNFKVTSLKKYKLLLLLIITCTIGIKTKAATIADGKDQLKPENTAASFVLSGTVVDDKDEVLPGATVRVLGSKKGTITDVYGKFLIEVASESDSISVAFVGFEIQHIRVGSHRALRVKLVPDEAGRKLNDVVVVGFGTQKKVSVTGAVSTVKISDLQQVSTPSLSNAIGGRLPGIITRQSSGEPGLRCFKRIYQGLWYYIGWQGAADPG